MKKILQEYAAYHIWANTRLFDCINQLTDEQIYHEVVSSFPGIFNTVLHIWDAERAWWMRLQKDQEIISVEDWFKGDFKELLVDLQEQSQQWQDWINATTDETLQQLFSYKSFNGEPFTQPLYEVIFHVFNHGTYHRGQLVTILRQLGVDKIPATDMILFSRNKK